MLLPPFGQPRRKRHRLRRRDDGGDGGGSRGRGGRRSGRRSRRRAAGASDGRRACARFTGERGVEIRQRRGHRGVLRHGRRNDQQRQYRNETPDFQMLSLSRPPEGRHLATLGLGKSCVIRAEYPQGLETCLPIPPCCDYLKTRRSVGIGFLKDPGPTPAELEEILTIGTRVPDHGKLDAVAAGGDRGRRAGAGGRKTRRDRRRRDNPDLDEASLDIERRQFLPAPLTIGVLFSPRPLPKAPELEQLLSAGNVCLQPRPCRVRARLCRELDRRAGTPSIRRRRRLLGARGGERFVGFVHIGTPTTRDRGPGPAGPRPRW